jgi:glycosyl transferase family 25
VALILEDDALFMHRRLRAFRLGDVPDDFDVVLLNSFLTREPPGGRIRRNIYDVSSYHGSAAAYLLSAKGAVKLMKAYRPVVHAADGLIGRCMELFPGELSPFKQIGAATQLRCYLAYPDCVLNGSTSHYHTSEVQPT